MRLTARQADVLRLLAQGLNVTEIAEALKLSPKTVRVYTCQIRIVLWGKDYVNLRT